MEPDDKSIIDKITLAFRGDDFNTKGSNAYMKIFAGAVGTENSGDTMRVPGVY